MRRFTVLVLAGLFAAWPCVVLAGPQAGPAAGEGGKHGRHIADSSDAPAMMWRDLNLTDDQKAKLKGLHDERKSERQGHMQRMKDMREKIKTELSREKPNSDTLMSYASQIAVMVEDMTKQRLQELLQVKQILTKDQFAKLLSKDMGFGAFGPRPHRPDRDGAHPSPEEKSN